MKGWPENSKILCVEQLDRAEKKMESKKFSLQIFHKYLFLNLIVKMFAAVYLMICSLTFSHPSASLLEFQLIIVKIPVFIQKMQNFRLF